MFKGITFQDVAEYYPMLYFAKVYNFEQDWNEHDEEELDQWVKWVQQRYEVEVEPDGAMKLRREESSDESTQGQQGSTCEQEEAQRKKVEERKIRLLNRRAFQIFIKLSNGQIQAKW
eukprot:7077960-Karenia_brevis.AAC.1